MDGEAGWLYSAAGVSQTACEIVVAAPARVGLHAYVSNPEDEQELVNLAALGGGNDGLASASPVPIAVRAVRSCHTNRGTGCVEGGSLVALPSGSVARSSSNPAAGTASVRGGSSCQLDALTTAHTQGGDLAVPVGHRGGHSTGGDEGA